MAEVLHQYDTHIDSKRRITLRNTLFQYFHVSEYEDGKIILEPRELVPPFEVSANTLKMMDEAVSNLKNGSVSEAIDLSAFEEV